MKKAKKLLSAIALASVLAMGCSLAACGDTPKNPDEPPVDETKIAGTYTLVSGDITYALTVEDNNDFNMTITKDFGSYTVTKTYLGPIHNINGVHMSTMPVFLASVEYDGTGHPDDADKLETGIQKAYGVFTASAADGVDGRERFITVDIANKTYSVDSGHSYTTLDYTEGYWSVEDLENAGYTYNEESAEENKWTAPSAN